MIKNYEYHPQRVCSQLIEYKIDDSDNKIVDVKIIGGCPGNTQGVCRLAKGRKCQEVIELLENIDCRNRGTSCPDQLAKGLKLILKGEIQPKQQVKKTIWIIVNLMTKKKKKKTN